MKTLAQITRLATLAAAGPALQANAEIGSGPFTAEISVEVQSDILYDPRPPQMR